MNTIKTLLAAVILTACGSENQASTEADVQCGVPPHEYCESTIGGGECSAGDWVMNEGQCTCHRTRAQCRESCGVFPVSGWSPFTCSCEVGP